MALQSSYRAPESTTVRKFLQGDGWMALAMFGLVLAGLMAVFSTAKGNGTPGLIKKQVLMTLIGTVPFLLLWRLPLNGLKSAANFLWVLNVGLLSFVLLGGSSAKGAQRWIELGFMQFQPSELSKLLCVLTLAAFFSKRREEVGTFKVFAMSFLHVAPTLILVFKQPHLGATVVVLVVWATACLISGIKASHLILGLLVLGIGGGATQLRGYQEDRIKAMRKSDELGMNYQVTMAELAYGSGGLFGTGYLKGEVKPKVPEQDDDFIFSVVGEEGGFAVCAMVLSLYTFLLVRIWLAMVRTLDMFARICAAGVFAILGFHMFVNLAMNLQLVPVVGLWLPFMSSGGTAMWLCLACVGLGQNVVRQQQKHWFRPTSG
jgi:rod shape determining protein RodA